MTGGRRGARRGGEGAADAQDALRRSEARLRAILATAVDAIVTIDRRGLIESVNAAAERMFGYSAAEMTGRNVSMLMPSPYREEHDRYLARHLQTGEKRIIGIGREVEARRKDGTAFAVDLAVSEVEPGRLFTGIIRDISDRRVAEARLREADRMASIGTLAAGLGHDMNNVLLPVRAHLNALKAAGGDGASRREHIERIQKGVAYLQQLADGLHFLAMDPDKADAAGAVTGLRAWWSQTGALLGKSVPRHVKVTVSIPEGLPDVAVAPHALTQAVLNLIVNAGEAIPAGRKRRQGSVRLWAERDGALVRLGVTDNGTGMTEEVRRRAFDMFFTTKPRGLGTGLGLGLVRKVVEGAGGSVRIDSAPGRGTTVEMALPAVETGPAGGPPVAAVRIRDGRAASLVRGLLEAAGARVEPGGDAAAADVWVIEPTPGALVDARAWHAGRAQRRIVLFGRPAGAGTGWRDLDVVTVEDPGDLDSVRAALGSAITWR
jgi:PAS domain S-box-containing protein